MLTAVAQSACLNYLAHVFKPNLDMDTGMMGDLIKKVWVRCKK